MDSTASSHDTNTSIAQLLHRTDHLSSSFNALHSNSFSYVQSIQSAYNQLVNLNKMGGGMATRSGGGSGSSSGGGTFGGGIKERGIVKVQSIIEESLGGVREELGKMEMVVEQL